MRRRTMAPDVQSLGVNVCRRPQLHGRVSVIGGPHAPGIRRRNIAATLASWTALPQPRWRASALRCPNHGRLSRFLSPGPRGPSWPQGTDPIEFSCLTATSPGLRPDPPVTLLSFAFARTKLYWCGTFSNPLPRNSTKYLTYPPAPALLTESS
jgi:hypothetical protein